MCIVNVSYMYHVGRIRKKTPYPTVCIIIISNVSFRYLMESLRYHTVCDTYLIRLWYKIWYVWDTAKSMRMIHADTLCILCDTMWYVYDTSWYIFGAVTDTSLMLLQKLPLGPSWIGCSVARAAHTNRNAQPRTMHVCWDGGRACGRWFWGCLQLHAALVIVLFVCRRVGNCI